MEKKPNEICVVNYVIIPLDYWGEGGDKGNCVRGEQEKRKKGDLRVKCPITFNPYSGAAGGNRAQRCVFAQEGRGWVTPSGNAEPQPSKRLSDTRSFQTAHVIEGGDQVLLNDLSWRQKKRAH